jgi:hypothetical protein
MILFIITLILVIRTEPIYTYLKHGCFDAEVTKILGVALVKGNEKVCRDFGKLEAADHRVMSSG